MFSIPTLDDDLKRILEPRAASARAKLKAMRVLADAGVPVLLEWDAEIPSFAETHAEALRAREFIGAAA